VGWKYGQTGKAEVVYRRSGGRCHYCGARLNPFKFQVEHMTPSSQGGGNAIENLTASCAGCNGKKMAKDVEEFRHWLLNRVMLDIAQAREKLHYLRHFNVGDTDRADETLAATERLVMELEVLFHGDIHPPGDDRMNEVEFD